MRHSFMEKIADGCRLEDLAGFTRSLIRAVAVCILNIGAECAVELLHKGGDFAVARGAVDPERAGEVSACKVFELDKITLRFGSALNI